jgi:Tol biopolymer transport system component
LETISVTIDGGDPNGRADDPGVSADGRYVVFNSWATNLVADAPGPGFFVRDRVANTTRRIADPVVNSSISATGRYIAFSTDASLAANDPGGPDVYLFDQVTDSFELVSVSMNGTGSGNSGSSAGSTLGAMSTSVSADGRYVAFASTATDIVAGDTDLPPGSGQPDGMWPDVYLRDRTLNTTTFVSQSTTAAGAFGFQVVISADGSTVVYVGSPHTAPGATLTAQSVMVYDVATGTTTHGSRNQWGGPVDGSQPSVTPDGNLIAFYSHYAIAPGMPVQDPCCRVAHLFVRDRSAGTVSLLSFNADGVTADREPFSPVLNDDGRYASIDCWCQRMSDGPTSGMGDRAIYRIDRATGQYAQVAIDGTEARPNAITGNGQSIVTIVGNNVILATFSS